MQQNSFCLIVVLIQTLIGLLLSFLMGDLMWALFNSLVACPRITGTIVCIMVALFIPQPFFILLITDIFADKKS
ncbi:MAG: hypothetical protein Q4C86_07690 [bacterium]|nr:hypothetical protein [bacterium]